MWLSGGKKSDFLHSDSWRNRSLQVIRCRTVHTPIPDSFIKWSSNAHNALQDGTNLFTSIQFKSKNKDQKFGPKAMMIFLRTVMKMMMIMMTAT